MSRMDQWFTEHELDNVAAALSEKEDAQAIAERLFSMLTSAFPNVTVPTAKQLASMYVQGVCDMIESGIYKKNVGAITITNVTTNNYNTPQNAPGFTQTHFPTPSLPNDIDPHRFDLGDVLDLRDKLEDHRRFAEVMQIQNSMVAKHKVGKLTARGVAVIGCIMRKNIRQNVTDPGAVPYDAITNFFRRNATLTESKKAPADLQIKGAIAVLEAVKFIKQVRPASKADGLCAAYALLNESEWSTPSRPSPIKAVKE
jgi:hypothetical protein